MLDDVIQRIKTAEKEAEALIHEARKAAHMEVNQATRAFEKEVQDFQDAIYDRLKRFREERVMFYKAEAERIRKEGRRVRASCDARFEKMFSEIVKEARRLIREEMCL